LVLATAMSVVLLFVLAIAEADAGGASRTAEKPSDAGSQPATPSRPVEQPATAPTSVSPEPAVSPAPIPPPWSGSLPAALEGHAERRALAPAFDRWAVSYGVAPDLLKAVAWRESRWDDDAISRRGAVGVGQLMPQISSWVSAELIGERLDPHEAGDNIRMSSRYLRWLLDETGGDVGTALAAYYQGLPSVRTKGWFGETRRYVDDVLRLRASFA
jgi:soluble lytic murein transglycosylase-like protein